MSSVLTQINGITGAVDQRQTEALNQFWAAIQTDGITPAQVAALAAELNIDLATCQSMLQAAKKTTDFVEAVYRNMGG